VGKLHRIDIELSPAIMRIKMTRKSFFVFFLVVKKLFCRVLNNNKKKKKRGEEIKRKEADSAKNVRHARGDG
jgi:hypothetical protein